MAIVIRNASFTLTEGGGRVTVVVLRDIGHVRDFVAPHPHIGRALMRAAADELRARGIAEWQGTTRVDNSSAIQSYEDVGMVLEQRSRIVRVPIARLSELANEPATALPVDPAEDDDLERALGLLNGRIAMMRSQGRRLVQLRDATCAPVGFAAIEASVALPFRVARPTLVRPLLEAIARTPIVQVVVDDDPELLQQIGETTLELLHYKGKLDAVRIAC